MRLFLTTDEYSIRFNVVYKGKICSDRGREKQFPLFIFAKTLFVVLSHCESMVPTNFLDRNVQINRTRKRKKKKEQVLG